MKNKYGPLCDYLKRCGKDKVRLSFSEIENIIGEALPNSAYEYPAWWGNRKPYVSQARAYIEAGYYVETLNLIEKWVVFIKE